MENALLILLIALAVALIGVVLVQRSEGGALGMGGGGGGGGVMSGRSAATALQKVTWYLAGGFIATSLALTVLTTTQRQSGSVLGRELPSISGGQFIPPTDGGNGDAAGEEPVLPNFAPPTIGRGDDVLPTIGGTQISPPSDTEPANLIPPPPE